MALSPGAQMGGYHIVGAIGAGGMGEVYRARDPRLGRDVAIKVIAAAFIGDAERLRRFEQEARAAAALNHPNILTVHEIGTHDGAPFVVSELLEGQTLRQALADGALPVRKALDVAVQVANGLAAAHEKGIVHRDLKPENIILTRENRAKILDFGLAKLTEREVAHAGATVLATRTVDTGTGMVLGTVGYMSPEQVRGEAVDSRSDIFSFGAVLYELVSGARAFKGDTDVETLSAILKQDPPDLAMGDAVVPPALALVIRHCLEKDPAERFQSARDLAFSLESLRSGSGHRRAAATAARPARRVSLTAAGAAVVVALVAGLVGSRALRSREGTTGAAAVIYTRLTYDKGTIWNARFAPDGQMIVYGASWDGRPVRSFLTRTERPGATPLSLPDAEILAVSSTGELAVSLGHVFEGWMGEGTLARAPMIGGAPRPILEHVREADWSPDGSELAIVRRADGRERLEFPIGTVLYETSGYISHIRFSPKGDRIAFADHPLYADDNGNIAVVDLSGRKTTLVTGLSGTRGVVWAPSGNEIWFTSSFLPHTGESLRGVTLDGRTRVLLTLPQDCKLLDVARDGRILMETEIVNRHIEAVHHGDPEAHDLSMFDQSIATALSQDGRTVLVTDQGSFAGLTYSTYLRRVDQAEAVRLGDGQGADLSPDGRWALSITFSKPSRIVLLPTGAGQAKELPNPGGLVVEAARFLPDGKRIVFVGAPGNEPFRGYIQSIDDGAVRPFTPPGVHAVRFWDVPMSPDGSRVALLAADGQTYLYPTEGGTPELLRTETPREYPIDWTADGRGMFVSSGTALPNRVFRVDLATGRRELWKEIMPSQAAGVRLSQVLIARDGRSSVHSFSQLLSGLYVAEGISFR